MCFLLNSVSVEVGQLRDVQLQALLCLPPVPAVGNKAANRNLVANGNPGSQGDGGISGQNQRNTCVDGASLACLLLPRAVRQPESLAWHPARGVTDRINGNDLTAQDTLVLH